MRRLASAASGAGEIVVKPPQEREVTPDGCPVIAVQGALSLFSTIRAWRVLGRILGWTAPRQNHH